MSDLTNAERDNIALGQRLECAEARIEAMEAALREIILECAEGNEFDRMVMKIARAVLAPEPDRP